MSIHLLCILHQVEHTEQMFLLVSVYSYAGVIDLDLDVLIPSFSLDRHSYLDAPLLCKLNGICLKLKQYLGNPLLISDDERTIFAV